MFSSEYPWDAGLNGPPVKPEEVKPVAGVRLASPRKHVAVQATPRLVLCGKLLIEMSMLMELALVTAKVETWLSPVVASVKLSVLGVIPDKPRSETFDETVPVLVVSNRIASPTFWPVIASVSEPVKLFWTVSETVVPGVVQLMGTVLADAIAALDESNNAAQRTVSKDRGRTSKALDAIVGFPIPRPVSLTS